MSKIVHCECRPNRSIETAKQQERLGYSPTIAFGLPLVVAKGERSDHVKKTEEISISREKRTLHSCNLERCSGVLKDISTNSKLSEFITLGTSNSWNLKFLKFRTLGIVNFLSGISIDTWWQLIKRFLRGWLCNGEICNGQIENFVERCRWKSVWKFFIKKCPSST